MKIISNYFQNVASNKKTHPFYTAKGMGKNKLNSNKFVTVSNIKDTVTFFI